MNKQQLIVLQQQFQCEPATFIEFSDHESVLSLAILAIAEMLEQFSEDAALPQSPPLTGEIASQTDSAEELFAKAQEYLESGCEEV